MQNKQPIFKSIIKKKGKEAMLHSYYIRPQRFPHYYTQQAHACQSYEPSVNILENKDGYAIELAVPGYKKEEFKLRVENKHLVLSSEPGEAADATDKGTYTQKEFEPRSFRRVFTLPDTVDADQIAAAYDNGILRVSIPKKAEQEVETKKTIEVM